MGGSIEMYKSEAVSCGVCDLTGSGTGTLVAVVGLSGEGE